MAWKAMCKYSTLVTISYWIYQSSFCFQRLIPFSIRYNWLYQLGYLLMWFPICYLHIVSGIFMPFGYPWCLRVFGWVSTQPGFIYPLDILQGSSCWGCLSLSLINHFLWLILRVQLLYSPVGNWFTQFQCAAIVHCCLFFFCHPILGSFLNFLLSAFIAFWFCSTEPLDTFISMVISSKAILFRLSSDSLLTSLDVSVSASLHMVSLHFPCSVRSSGFSFWQECLLAGLLSNSSIALFIASWNSFMNSTWSALWLASDKVSLSSDSSWSLLWSRVGCFAASCQCTSPVHLLNSPVVSHLSVDRHCRTCSCVFGGISSTTLSSVTVSVKSWTLCMSGAFLVIFPTVSI